MNLRKTLLAAAVAAATFVGSLPARAGDGHDHRHDRPRYDDRAPRYEDRRGPRAGDQELLGHVTAGREMRRDVVEVRGHARYSAIVFRVDRGDAEVEDVKVTFENDQTHHADTKHHFHEGDRSCRLDLPGIDRDIKRVRFLFRSAHGGRVVIQVFGVVR